MAMAYMKYIVFEGHLDDNPVIFPSSIDHSVMARMCDSMGEVRSAGFFSLEDDELSCYGHSHSLGVKAHPSDTAILKRMLGHGR